jgi:G3E family GTPase
VKGVVHVAGEAEPVAIHGVHHVFHPPQRVAHMDEERRSRVVFITKDLPREAVEAEWRRAVQ